MSAPKKGSNRVKGNLKPSSSSQAAQLLAGQAPGFIGFGFQSSPSFVPLSHLLDDVDSSLDSDIRLVLRKLSKRDTTTKIKALQELGEICQQKDVEVLKSMLPFWPRLYNRLAMDVDHKVREEVQQTFLVITSKVKKDIAPYLKSIMGCWVLSQCDTYPTVSSAATQVFLTTFPGPKQSDALTAYRQDIFEYLVDNITRQTPQSLSDPKTTSSEDMESKYTRTIAASLVGLRKLLCAVSEPKMSSLKSAVINLFQDGNFWKHSKSAIPGVKCGLYSFLAVSCQKFPDIATEYCNKLTPIILHNFDVANPVILGPMWEAVLSLVNFVPECWSHISWQKAFWPKLRKSLEAGCYGNASTVGPSILPLLSKIPSNFYSDKNSFYTEFLCCMKCGLKEDNISKSNIETAAFVKAYIECFHYIINQYLVSDTPDENFVKDLTNQCILELMKSSLTADKPPSYSTYLYSCFRSTLKILEKTAKSKEVLGYFWHQLQEYVLDLLGTDVTLTCERLSTMIKCFIVQDFTSKKSMNLRFEDVEKKVKVDDMKLVTSDSIPQAFTDFYAFLMHKVYLKMQNANDQRKCLKFFSEMFELFMNDEILNVITPSESSEGAFNNFFQQMCLPMLKSSSDSFEESAYLMSVSLTCLEMMNSSESSIGFLQFLDNCDGMIQKCLVIEKLTEKSLRSSKVRNSCQSKAMTEMIVNLVKQTCVLGSDGKEDKLAERGWQAITLVLASFVDEEKVFSTDCLEAVLFAIGEQLTNFKKNKGNTGFRQAIKLVTQAACSFFDNLKNMICTKASEELLITLFRLELDEAYNLDKDTANMCEMAWSKGLKLLLTSQDAKERGSSFINDCCQFVNHLISSKDCSYKLLKIILQKVDSLLKTIEENGKKEILKSCVLNLSIPFSEKYKKQFDSLISCVYISGGRLSATEYIPQKVQISCEKDLPIVLNQGIFKTELLRFSILGSKTENPDATDYELNSTEMECLNDIFFSLSVSKTLYHFEEAKIESLKIRMDDLQKALNIVLQSLKDRCRKDILSSGIRVSEEDGKIRSVMLELMLEMLVPTYCTLNAESMIDRWANVDLTSEIVHTIQTTVPYLSNVDVQQIADYQTSKLLTSLSTTNEWLGYRSIIVITSCLSKLVTDTSPEILETSRLTINNVLRHLMNWREIDDTFLISADTDLTDTKKVITNIEVMRFLSLAVKLSPEQISDKEWDMILCCLVDWAHRIPSWLVSEELLVTSVAFALSVSDLLYEVSLFMQTKIHTKDSTFPENLATEWEEFFCDGIFSDLIPLFVSLAGEKDISLLLDKGCRGIGKALKHCNKAQILKHKLPAYLIAGDESSVSSDIQTVLNHFCPFLLSDRHYVQTTAACVLEKILEDVYQAHVDLDKGESQMEESCSQSPPTALMDVIEKGGHVMDLVLDGMSIGDQYIIQSNSEECQYAYGYMLAWRLLLIFFKTADPQMRAKYATHLKDKNLFSKLLRHVFCILPSERTMSHMPLRTFKDQDSDLSEEVDTEKRAFNLLYRCLETTPALVRQWWMDLDRKTSLYVDKFTTKYVSPQLCVEEIASVQPSSDDLEGITIKPKPASREIVATYVMAEVKIVITITLPENFPLGVIVVSSDKRVGATQAQWDRWLLQLNIFLQHQNGTIVEGLKLWKKNIDKRFDGVDDCMICFSVLHGTTFQLPRLQCRTCKKKYHSACLYKWFSTSMNSTCPLCRNLF